MELKNLKTVTFSGQELKKLKETTDPQSPLLKKLKTLADDLLSQRPYHVVARTLHAESGNVHDYMSMGPYWWPNPDTESGLPYIRRDGEINPETVMEDTYEKMSESVFLLSLAAFWFEDRKYGQKAESFLKAWHLDPQTYMTPHLEYGQAIPGICSGRGIGLTDTATSYQIFDAIAILQHMEYISNETVVGIKNWYREFVDWMLTSEKGLDEDQAHNNHGAWYDVQIASAAIFTGRISLATKTLRLAYDRRIKAHIREDGAQPSELARTRALHYSLYNLKALLLLAAMADNADIDCGYWDEPKQDRPLLRKAVDFLTPYVNDLSAFPYQEISTVPPLSSFAEILMAMDARYPQEGYGKIAAELIDDTMLWRLYPRF